MPCGKKPFIKNWDRPKNIQVVKHSRYEQNEASVKLHWKNVIRSLEDSYKDDQFWESQYEIVRDLLSPVIFHRMTKIFNLPSESKKYEPPENDPAPLSSEKFYEITPFQSQTRARSRITFSVIDFQRPPSDLQTKEQSEHWTVTTHRTSEYKQMIRSRSSIRSKSTKSMWRSKSSKSFPKFISRKSQAKTLKGSDSSLHDTPPESDDDLKVHASQAEKKLRREKNPHFNFLYCHESEADMITWNSKFKQKGFEVSASDQFNKAAEIATKKIATEFYEWWSKLGTGEFKSEIRRPEDIEDLFQVWFDEHASRGLMLDPKILPCVKQSIAEYVGEPKTSCPNVLKRQIASDIRAETSPAHTTAFGTSLPQHSKHLPPRNNTEKAWGKVKIPEDLKSMAAIWEQIQHLTSTKTFHSWLKMRHHLPIPPFFKSLDVPGEKKQLFVVPSDFVVVSEKSSTTIQQDLAFPVSEFTLELKAEISKILND